MKEMIQKYDPLDDDGKSTACDRQGDQRVSDKHYTYKCYFISMSVPPATIFVPYIVRSSTLSRVNVFTPFRGINQRLLV